jgi:vitamin B12 transporter
MLHFLILAPVAAAAPEPPDEPIIVVTASRESVEAEEAPVSATVIDRGEIAAQGLPMTADLLRLVPGVSVALSGPRGTQTQVRIRGAEANHSLLFVDGIRFNDPAAGNEARFELLTNDALSRLEVVRGPQSALWGSEALGGVIALDTADPIRSQGLSGLAEYGSGDSARASAQFGLREGEFGLAGSAGWLRGDGIDSFGPSGERDGFDNRSASLKAVLSPAPALRLGLVGHWVEATSEFDGFDPVVFGRTEDLESKSRIGALRGWVSATPGPWTLSAGASFLASVNRNLFEDAPLNRTGGQRLTAGAQVSRKLGTHRFTAAGEHEEEEFHAGDQGYFGATDQDRSRSLTALVGEWRAEWSRRFSTDLALRHDRFSAYPDARTLRAAALFSPAEGWRLHAGYGEGIAQPTFYDLHGFYPGNFVGNPTLRPESSKSVEAGLRWGRGPVALGATAYASRLTDEIVDVFDPVTFVSSTANAGGRSRRRGLELEGEYRPSRTVRLGFNYAWLDAEEQKAAGGAVVRELRRPRHSANLLALGEAGALTWGASAAYVGKRRDMDFDAFPAQTVVLKDYLLASFNLGYRLTRSLEAYVRAENAFGANYQDVFGYKTPGRTVHAGLRIRLRD